MTVIRLDAATLAKFAAVDGPVTLCDEAGNPVRRCVMRTLRPLDEEPHYTEEEWQQLMSSGARYTTEEVLARLRRPGGA